MDPATFASFERAYSEFMQSLHTMVAGVQSTPQLAETFAEYQRIVQAGVTNEETQRRAAEAYNRHVQALQQALSPEHARQRAAEAYRRYLDALKQAWTEVDPASIHPAALAAIAQSMASTAMTIGNVIGPMTASAQTSGASR